MSVKEAYKRIDELYEQQTAEWVSGHRVDTFLEGSFDGLEKAMHIIEEECSEVKEEE